MNKLCLFLAAALLMYPVAGFAADHVARDADLTALKELDQAHMDALKDSLAKDLQIQSARLDAQDKRLDQQDKLLQSFSERIGDLSMFLTLFGVVAGFVGYFTVRNRAQQEAKLAAAEWLEKNGKEAVKEKLEELDVHIDSQKKATAERLEDLYNNAATQMIEIQKQMGAAPMSLAPEASGPEQAVAPNSDAISKLVEVLKNKPEAEYGFDDWNARAHDAYSKGKMALAAEYWLQAARGGNARGVQVAQSLFNAGVVLTTLNRRDEALAVYDEAISRYGNAPEIELRNQVAMALVNKSAILVHANRNEESIATCDDIMSRYGNATEPVLREQTAKALFGKGVALTNLQRNDDALAVYNEVALRYGAATELPLRTFVAQALLGKGIALAHLKRTDEALAAYDEVVSRYGNDLEKELRVLVAMTLFNRGASLEQANRYEEEAATFDELVSRYGNAQEIELRKQTALALFGKGVALTNLTRTIEALAVYDEVVSRYGKAPEKELREPVAMALVNKSAIFLNSDRNNEAMAVCDEVVSRYGDASEIALVKQVAKALLTKGGACQKLGRYDDTISAHDMLLSRYGNSPEATMQNIIGEALNGKGFALLCRAKANWGHDAARLDDLQTAVELFAHAEPQMDQSYVALGNHAYATFLLDKQKDARTLLERALKQGGEYLYKATLGDIGIHTIPPDTDFRALLDATWEAISPRRLG